MLTTSQLYKTIYQDVKHSVEWRITINGVIYGMNKIAVSAGGGDSRPKLSRRLLSDDGPSVGGTFAGTFSCAIFEATQNIPRMAAVVPSYRLVLGNQASEWITLGTFYIDTRKEDKANGALILACCDSMLKADGVGGRNYASVTGFSTWPQTMAAVAGEIATIIGVTIDSRTTVKTGNGFMVEYPNDLTMREVLGYIAAAHGANWTITPRNQLRLVPLTGNADSQAIALSVKSLQVSPALSAWSGVTVYYSDEEAYQSGTETGRVLECDCPWATQNTADGILATVSGTTYQPFTTDGAIFDLALELGDILTVGKDGETVSGPVFTLDLTCDPLSPASLTAPGEEEIDHEYPYASAVDRAMKRKVSLGQSYYGTSISREKGIEIARSDGKSEALFNSDTFSMRALIDGVMQDRIYFDPEKGDYIFNGALGADAVFTDSLYAETGEVAELTVDRLSTSRRIRKFILNDLSDDNYVKIQDQYIQFVTGTLVYDVVLQTESGLTLLTEDGEPLLADHDPASAPPVQAVNRYGQGLYWQREPVGHTSDGYPLDIDGVQIYAGTEETDWPVYVFQYFELVKAQFAFEEYTTSQGDQTYAPVIVLGAGDENGNSKGYFLKEQNEMILRYVTSGGEETDIRLSDFVDAKHRRLQSCTIDTANGEVSYTVEGDDNEYGLTFAVEDDTVTYTWSDGFTCEVTVL